MKLLAMERDVAGVDASRSTDDLMTREAETVWGLYQTAVVRELYFAVKDNENLAVLILECGGVEEARQRLGELPLVRAGLIDFEIYPLEPYPGFARLFGGAK